MAVEFIGTVEHSINRASIGIADPVRQGRVVTTNLPWDVAESGLARTLKIPEVKLINDLKAIAHAVVHLESSDLHTLNIGEGKERESLAVIASGTGLGEAFLIWSNGKYHAHPSEGATRISPLQLRKNENYLDTCRRGQIMLAWSRSVPGGGSQIYTVSSKIPAALKSRTG